MTRFFLASLMFALAGTVAIAGEVESSSCRPVNAALTRVEQNAHAVAAIVSHSVPAGVEIDEKTRKIFVVDHSANPSKMEQVGTYFVVPAGTKFYHWGPSDLTAWGKSGFPDDAGMRQRRAVSGFYVSGDITNSDSFGPVLVAYVTKRAMRIADITGSAPDLAKAEGVQMTNDSEGWQQKIDDPIGMDGHNDGYESMKWLAVYHPAEVIQPHLATIDDFYESDKFKAGQMDIEDFLVIDGSYHLTPTATLKNSYPVVYAILKGSPLSRSDEQRFLKSFAEFAMNSNSFLLDIRKHGTGKLFDMIKARFGKQLNPAIVQAYRQAYPSSNPYAKTIQDIPSDDLAMAKFFGISPESLLHTP